jgi:hypothetical protein
LREIQPHFSKLLVVVNGKLTADSRDALEGVVNGGILVRENSGFDVWAYKSGIDLLGWAELETYDEVIFLNFTIMGPTHPFSEMFDEMDGRDLDFWGMTVHNGADSDPWGLMPEGFIPLHIQSHFIAVRQRMVKSPTFQAYWDTMGPINSYEEAIAKHEALFTSRFEDAGFRWGVYVDTVDTIGRMYYPLFNIPVDLIENRRCPVFKRKIFFSDARTFIDENANQVARELMDYLARSKRFDVTLILDHIVRSANLHDTREALNLNRVVLGSRSRPSLTSAIFVSSRVPSPGDVVRRAREVAPHSDVFVLHSGDGPAPQLGAEVQVIAHEEQWEFLAAVEQAAGYDAAAFIDECQPVSPFPLSLHDARLEQNLASMLHDAPYVNTLVNELAGDGRIGVVYPPPPLHGPHFSAIAHGWMATFALVDRALKKSGIVVPRSPVVPPGFPEAGALWWSPRALDLTLLRQVSAAILDDGSSSDPRASQLVHALRAVIPLVAQHQGYLSHSVMPPQLAENRMTTGMTHFLERVASAWSYHDGDAFSAVDHRFATHGLASPFSSGRLQSRFYFDMGGGFTEDHSVDRDLARTSASGDFRASVVVPAGTVAVRFDPIEGSACVIGGIEAGSRNIVPLNGIRRASADFFATVDPQYEVAGRWRGGGELTVTVKRISLIGASDWLEESPVVRVPTMNRLRGFVRRVREWLSR